MRKITKISIITTLVLIMLFSVVLFSACNRGEVKDFYGRYVDKSGTVRIGIINASSGERKHGIGDGVVELTDTGIIWLATDGVGHIHQDYEFEDGVKESANEIIYWMRTITIVLDKESFIIKKDDQDIVFDISKIFTVNHPYVLFEDHDYSIMAKLSYSTNGKSVSLSIRRRANIENEEVFIGIGKIFIIDK